MRLLQSHYLTHFSLPQHPRTAPWPARLFAHPRYPIAQKPLPPLVASSSRYPIFPAQRSKVLTPQRPHSKFYSLFHRFTFSPWHAEVLPHHTNPKSVTYVLNLLCIRCPEPAPPSAKGEGRSLGRRFAEDDAGVDSAETKRVAHDILEACVPPVVWNNVEITIGIGIFVIDRGRDPLAIQS
jgi:hypothetical protein